MQFRTILNLKPSDVKIGHNDLIFMIGSCFTSYIGQKLVENKFSTMVNPYGTIYHPAPIKGNIAAAIRNQSPIPELITRLENRHVYLKMHSKVSSNSIDGLISLIENLNRSVNEYLHKAKVVVMTLGSAFYFFHNELSEIVGNCHKLPANLFTRKLSSITDVKRDIQDIIDNIFDVNPSCQIIFTVSPVRHLRDGLISNSLSKAHLISAIHQLVAKNQRTQYFPAYEILMDDLRGYRYYSDDMVHPNDQAIGYIWQIFSDQYFTSQTKDLNLRIGKINKIINHRPFDPSSDSYNYLLQKVKKDIEHLESEVRIRFTKEKSRINELLNEFL